MKIFKILTLITLVLINANRLLAQRNPISPENQRTTYITGKIYDGFKHDTLSLVLTGPFYNSGESPQHDAIQTLTTTIDKNGEFKFKILAGNSPFHVSLFLSNDKNSTNGLLITPDINDYLIQPGDSIHVGFNRYVQYYSGKGAYLFEAQYAVEQIDKGDKYLTYDPDDYFRRDITKWLVQKDSILNVKFGMLATYRSKISESAYGIVRADIIGDNRAWIYRRINFAGPFAVVGTPLKQDLANICIELEHRPAYINQEDRASLSPKYVHYLYDKLRTEVKYAGIVNSENAVFNQNYFSAINKKYTGILRDKLLAYWLTQITAFNNLHPEYITNALSVMQTPAFIQIAEDLKATFIKGGTVTDFDFKDAKGKTVHLGDFKGKVLFIDLWFSGCSGCVAVAAGLPHVEEAFKNRTDVAFISISIDKDQKLWLQSIDKNPSGKHYTHYTTPTTTYLYTAGTASDNPFIKKYVPTGSYPSLLIIDKNSKIFSATPSRPITEQGIKDLTNEIEEALVNK